MPVELTGQGLEVLNEDPLVIKNPKDWFHIHSYGQLTPFFKGLREEKLLGTHCTTADCEPRAWLPPHLSPLVRFGFSPVVPAMSIF